MSEIKLDPAKLREGGRAALAELDAKHEAISELQDVIDDTWRQAYDIESRLKAILVYLGAMSADEPFDENLATRVLGDGDG